MITFYSILFNFADEIKKTMILIADSGATKTDWCLSDNGKIVVRAATQGINPFHQNGDVITGVITKELFPALGNGKIDKVCFYGSGCRGDKIEMMENIFISLFPESEIDVNGDLLAAARAVCGFDEGIACILGTGSNSCLYDGKEIIDNVPPLGYILGDEGSGAVLGKLFINAIFKGELDSMKDEFMKDMNLSLDGIIDRVYCQPLPNRFLASISIFIHKHLDDSRVKKMVTDSFVQFFKHNVCKYGHADLSVGAVGSIAYYFKDELSEAAKSSGYNLGAVVRSPLEGLVKFHK